MEKRKPNMNPDQYLQVLRGNTMRLALEKELVPAPFIVNCIEAGVIVCRDKTLLAELERAVGRTIIPRVAPDLDIAEEARNSVGRQTTRVSSTAGMPVVGDKTPFFARPVPVPADMMYRQVVAETDARIASDPILRDKALSPSILYNARQDWCTPELMKALVMDTTFVFRLRCAMYPYLVSYCERVFDVDGKTYLVPYITVFNGSQEDGTTVLSKGRFSYDKKDGKGVYDTYGTGNRHEAQTTTFYLNSKGKIGMMEGIIKHMYDPSDFSSPETVRRYMGELKEAYNAKINSGLASDARKRYKQDLKDIEGFLEPYASGKTPIKSPETLMNRFVEFHRPMVGWDTKDTFINIKTGESGYSVTRNDRKASRMDGPGWEQVIDITPCLKNSILNRALVSKMFERQKPGSVERIRTVGLESLRRLHDKMLSTDRCVRTNSGTYADLEGQDEFRDYFRD